MRLAVFGLCVGVLIAIAYFGHRESESKVPVGGFKSCAQAEAAGVGSMWFFHKGYRKELDADHDGRACEWNGGLF